MDFLNIYRNQYNFRVVIKIILVSFVHFLLSIPFSFLSFSQIGDNDIKAFWQPPGYIFQIVWPLLYILFGIISLQIIFSKNISNSQKNQNIKESILEAVGQSLWILSFSKFSGSAENFYRFKLQYFLSFFIIFSLMIYAWFVRLKHLYKLNNKLFLLYIPYVLWISFATILNSQILWRIIYNY